MSRSRVPVAARFVLGYLLAAGVVSTLIIHHIVSDHEAQLIHEIVKKGEAITRLFARSEVTALYQLDVDQMESAVSHVTKDERDVTQIVLFNEHGQVITDGSKDNERLGDVLVPASDVSALSDTQPREALDGQRIRFLLRVKLGDKILGGVSLDVELKTAREKADQLRDKLALLAMIMTLLGALPVWLVSHFLIKPLVFGD